MPQESPSSNLNETADKISVIPILAFLKSGLRHYLRTTREIFRLGGRFAALRWTREPIELHFRAAISDFVYANFLAFFIYAPIAQFKDLEIHTSYFLAQTTYHQIVIALCTHLALKIFAGQGTIRHTLVVNLSLHAALLPLFIILTLPAWFYMPTADFLTGPGSGDPPDWLIFWLTPILLLFFAWSLIVDVNWLSSLHQISRGRVLLASVLLIVPLVFVHDIFIKPHAAKAVKFLSKVAEMIAG